MLHYLRPDYALIIMSRVKTGSYFNNEQLARFVPAITQFIYLGMKYECSKNTGFHFINHPLLNSQTGLVYA